MLPLARLLRFLQLQVNLFVSFQQSLLVFLLYQPVPQIDRLLEEFTLGNLR